MDAIVAAPVARADHNFVARWIATQTGWVVQPWGIGYVKVLFEPVEPAAVWDCADDCTHEQRRRA